MTPAELRELVRELAPCVVATRHPTITLPARATERPVLLSVIDPDRPPEMAAVEREIMLARQIGRSVNLLVPLLDLWEAAEKVASSALVVHGPRFVECAYCGWSTDTGRATENSALHRPDCAIFALNQALAALSK